ncbi:MAG: hypothetical protein EOO47_17545 [Flavobacterium sp.]|nr:MAG: hypothetical protein EOO47_17545 [Flavobacterium sp.]
MKFIISLIAILLFGGNELMAQKVYSGKAEMSYLFFQDHLVKYDLIEGNEINILDGNAVEIASSHGFKINQLLYAGIGLAYFKGSGNDYLGWYFDFDLFLSQKKVRPIIGVVLGNDYQLNKQHSSSFRFDFTGGVAFNLTSKNAITLKSGIAMRQQSSFIPVKLGFTF